MQKLIFLLAALMMAACNLSAPGSTIDLATPTTGQIQPTSNLITPAAQTDWATYTNTQNGYTIQRPRSVSLVEENAGNLVFIDDQIEITVSDINPEEARGGGVPVMQETSDIMVGEYAARRITGYIGSIGGVTPQNMEQVIVPHNNRFYVFTVYELKRSAWNGEATRVLGSMPAAAVELFNSILTTLRFDS